MRTRPETLRYFANQFFGEVLTVQNLLEETADLLENKDAEIAKRDDKIMHLKDSACRAIACLAYDEAREILMAALVAALDPWPPPTKETT